MVGNLSIGLTAFVLLWTAAAACAVDAHGQANGGSHTALKPPDCRARVERLNDDGSLLKSERLLDLERRHAETPADEAVTKELTQELVDIAQHLMFCSPAPPPRKYPIAYCLYGRVLTLDKSNKAAIEALDLIEGIYKTLERPLPDRECP